MRVLALLLTFALAACTTTNIDTAIQQSAPQMCAAAAPLLTAFDVAAAGGAVSQRAINNVAKARAVLDPICANPSAANSTTILIAAANAYVAIVNASKEIR